MNSENSNKSSFEENPTSSSEENGGKGILKDQIENNENLVNSGPDDIKPDFPIPDDSSTDRFIQEETLNSNKTETIKEDILSNTNPFILPSENETKKTSIPSGTAITQKRHAPPYATQPYRVNTGLSGNTYPSTSAEKLGKVNKPFKGETKQVQPGQKQNSTRKPNCFFLALVGVLVIGLLGLFIVGAAAIYQYYILASSLPSISNLSEKASQFETVRIMDRNGDLLYEMISPTAGRRTYVPIDQISPYLIAATIATEDKEFYDHPGYDPFAIARALVQNYTAGETVSGASTITQQLARMLLFSQEERGEQSFRRKAREIVLAAEITRQYTKEQILELYLNEVYYGNIAYGIEAAAETYFNTTSDKLTLSQASFLAGLPQAPGVYDIFSNRDATLNRQIQVLDLMVQQSQEKNCIHISTNIQPVCIDPVSAANAAMEIADYPFAIRQNNMRFPHWVNYIRNQLEILYEPQTIFRSGFTVFTTIDPSLQELAERIVKEQVSTLAERNVSDGALIAIQPSTGQILSMVGSADFYNVEISGQVNMAVSPRQPGSSIKPITYTAAFEKGWTPATLIWDVPSEFPPSGDPNDPREPYKPINYDEKFHGPVTVRSALANSYNVPAVKTLNFIGIYDNPSTKEQEGFISLAKRLGITTLTRDDYGLSLTLGGGEVTLLDMTSVFSVFANIGNKVEPVAILRIEDSSGKEIFQYSPKPPALVIRPEHAYLITSILSDNTARTPMFGENSILRMPFDAAAKTGTTNDFRDNWTMGYTPDLAVGVWVGNADYSPMLNTSGLTGAAPIWAEFMRESVPYITKDNPTSFSRPGGIVERTICTISGTEPSSECPETRSEIFASDQLPLPREYDFYSNITIDTWTGKYASGVCQEYQKSLKAITVDDEWGRKWLKETDQGRNWLESSGFSENIRFAPKESCSSSDPKPEIFFPGLDDGQRITESPIDIYAVANVPSGFKDFVLEYGIGDEPEDWENLAGPFDTQLNAPERLVTWDVTDLHGKVVTIRIVMNGTDNNFAEKRIRLALDVPEPTPIPTLVPTITPTFEPTLTPTVEILPSATIEPTIDLSIFGTP
jgi:penicillin-binding protein 1C